MRLADLRGYSYDRARRHRPRARQRLRPDPRHDLLPGGEKPYEVEIVVAEVGDAAEDDQIYRLTYDGSVADEQGFAVMGGSVDSVQEYLTSHYSEGLDLAAALRLAADALGHEGTSTREVNTERLEVAVLDRTRTQPRKFRRVEGRRLADLFAGTTPAATEPEPERNPRPSA